MDNLRTIKISVTTREILAKLDRSEAVEDLDVQACPIGSSRIVEAVISALGEQDAETNLFDPGDDRAPER